MSARLRTLAAIGTVWYLLVLCAPWERSGDAIGSLFESGGTLHDANTFPGTAARAGFHSWLGVACVVAALALVAALAWRRRLVLPLAAVLVVATAARVVEAAEDRSMPHAIAVPLVAASALAVALLGLAAAQLRSAP